MKQKISYITANPFVLFSILFIWIFSTGCTENNLQIHNPYQSIDWENTEQHKANFHTHTVRSDGSLNPQVVVDEYHAMGYSILAITDHNEVTYPWTEFSSMEPSSTSLRRLEENPDRYEEPFVFENRNPDSLGMIAIQSNELSAPHHTGSFFNAFNDRQETEEDSWQGIADQGGIGVVFHPGRYQHRNPEKYSAKWYVEKFIEFPHLIGLEIYNQGDRYPNDRILYDSLLTELMPDRNLWAFSNDDMHGRNALGRNWNVFPLSELTSGSVRNAMQNGSFYYMYVPLGHEGPEHPSIQSIKVDQRKGIITISASNAKEFLWISGEDTLQRGMNNSIKVSDYHEIKGYVRAEIWGEGASVLGTQPFGLETSN